MAPRKRTKTPRRPQRGRFVEEVVTPTFRLVDGNVSWHLTSAASVKPPSEWEGAIDTILAAWATYNATTKTRQPDDETLRIGIGKKLGKARELFILGHGAEDGQTCRCRIWALLTVVALDTSGGNVQEAEQIFNTHKKIVQSYLDATREVN